QRQWLENALARENVLVTGNRWGKSFVSAVKLLRHALFRIRGSLAFDGSGRYRAVAASITQDQANLLFNQVVRLARQSPVLRPRIASLVRSPYPMLTLGNGAVIEARSTQNRGEYLLGNDYDLFVFDEVAFEADPEYVVEEVLLMRLADREGMLDLVSTPNGKNWFYRRVRELAQGARPGYFQSGDSRANPYISRAFLDERVRHFTARRLAQNIEGQFVDSGGEVIRGSDIDAALAGISGSEEAGGAASGEIRYLSGWDLARKRTATVGITVAAADGPARVVALERLKETDWATVIARIRARQEQYPGQLVIDATGLGDPIVEALREYRPTAVIFTGPRKAELLTNVELFHARRRIVYERWELPDGPGRTWSLEDELRRARWDDNCECDSLMALALALWPLRTRPAPVIAPRLGRA
ncbi:MAG TPA: terminase family protein, partial [candidate division Zixibacteria bacterium]|nr:terminase family protein [candidate division Zixibacteria bacterium]